MTTETKEAVPVLDILREGGVVEINRLGDHSFCAALRGSGINMGHWYAEEVGASPLGALMGLLKREERDTKVTLTDPEQRLCLAAVALSERLWNGPQDRLYRAMLLSWLKDTDRNTELLPREVLQYLMSCVAYLNAYAWTVGDIYDGRSPERRNRAVKLVSRALLVRIVTASGYSERMVDAQLNHAEQLLLMVPDLPGQVILDLDGAL